MDFCRVSSPAISRRRPVDRPRTFSSPLPAPASACLPAASATAGRCILAVLSAILSSALCPSTYSHNHSLTHSLPPSLYLLCSLHPSHRTSSISVSVSYSYSLSHPPPLQLMQPGMPPASVSFVTPLGRLLASPPLTRPRSSSCLAWFDAVPRRRPPLLPLCPPR